MKTRLQTTIYLNQSQLIVKIKVIIWIQRQNSGSVPASKQAFCEQQVFLEIVQKRSISALRISGILARPPQRVAVACRKIWCEKYFSIHSIQTRWITYFGGRFCTEHVWRVLSGICCSQGTGGQRRNGRLAHSWTLHSQGRFRRFKIWISVICCARLRQPKKKVKRYPPRMHSQCWWEMLLWTEEYYHRRRFQAVGWTTLLHWADDMKCLINSVKNSS